MIDVTNFLMRWLFLSNLIQNIADIQTMPHDPNLPSSPQPSATAGLRLDPVEREKKWRDEAVSVLCSYPAGTQRTLVLDAMRSAQVHSLCQAMERADQVIKHHQVERAEQQQTQHASTRPSRNAPLHAHNADGESHTDIDDDHDDDDYLDADFDILDAFSNKQTHRQTNSDGSNRTQENGAKPSSTPTDDEDEILEMQKRARLEDARQTIRTVRDYLPQLISSVLRSPPAIDANLVDPISKLRSLIIERCKNDANWGIDTCWLLEAEVGRGWKTIFEHRQQTGRRLIIVLPKEKAAVLEKIGQEKRHAFELLQDAEQATAYGYTPSMELAGDAHDLQHTGPRLPSSLSLRRCSHFGDTMHFIDRLTKTSLDLRRVPTIHRHAYLQDYMREINRRLRRRMITNGDVSLDVEDCRGPDDWPFTEDITETMLKYSVHLPIDPSQGPTWPGGSNSNAVDTGVVRVLNIVVDECRVLSSRERCPFLVQVEVADTNLRGDDARLYAQGAQSLGTTVEEALGIGQQQQRQREWHPETQPHANAYQHPVDPLDGRKPMYEIPDELLAQSPSLPSASSTLYSMSFKGGDRPMPNSQAETIFRGGHQSDDGGGSSYPYMPNEYNSGHYGAGPMQQQHHGGYYPQQQHQPFHSGINQPQGMLPQNAQQLQQHPSLNANGALVPTDDDPESPTLLTSDRLLEMVFGKPWDEKCREIRQTSAYGKVDGWRLASFIVKAGEDIRREALVMQIITKLNEWFSDEIAPEFRPHLRPYTIMCVGGDAGLVECLTDAKSIDEVKKRTDGFDTLRDFFERAYGKPTQSRTTHPPQGAPFAAQSPTRCTFEEAQENFLRSLVGYSLVCYILQIKDRHNANILLDRSGNIMHIDFGYVLGDTTKMGKVPIFSETAPFKLSTEFWDVLGGWDLNKGGLGVKFCMMFEKAYACASLHREEIASLVEAMMLTLTENPRTANAMANGVRQRLKMKGPAGGQLQQKFIMDLVNAALTNWGTTSYDWLQKNMNGYR